MNETESFHKYINNNKYKIKSNSSGLDCYNHKEGEKKASLFGY